MKNVESENKSLPFINGSGSSAQIQARRDAAFTRFSMHFQRRAHGLDAPVACGRSYCQGFRLSATQKL